jgi:hypothetical protein
MRLRRMTTRRWMIVIAIAALVMTSGRLLWISTVYLKAALIHAAYETEPCDLQRVNAQIASAARLTPPEARRPSPTCAA